jgi:hypothetical protein
MKKHLIVFAAVTLNIASAQAASATTCFVRQAKVVAPQLSIGQEICFSKPELKLNYFEGSKAVLRYTIDGVAGVKEVELENPTESAAGYVFDLDFEEASSGGICDESWSVTSKLQIQVSRATRKANLASMQATVDYTYDSCHLHRDVVQTIAYSKKN